jgi:hypothetical protein
MQQFQGVYAARVLQQCFQSFSELFATLEMFQRSCLRYVLCDIEHCASQTKRGLEKQIDKLQSALDCCNEDRRTSQREQEHIRELLEKELAEVVYNNCEHYCVLIYVYLRK